MITPDSPRFLGVRFKRARFAWWKLTGGGRDPLMNRLSYRQALNLMRSLEAVHKCPHENRRFNPKATAVSARGGLAEICNQCGVGIITRFPRRDLIA